VKLSPRRGLVLGLVAAKFGCQELAPSRNPQEVIRVITAAVVMSDTAVMRAVINPGFAQDA
jgi:hypothetical protein